MSPVVPTVDPWTLPIQVAGQAYRHRRELRSLWKQLSTRLRGEKSVVAITGLPGVGKTVILDHLTGAAAKETYRPPGRSRAIERGLRKAAGLRMLLRVIPGQESPVRVQGLGDLFNAKRPVAGLVHVVANGYSDVREDFARSQLEEQMTLDEFRAAQRTAEIEDLRTTLIHVRGAMQRHRRRFWIVVAVNKADLFAGEDSLRDAKTHYAAAGSDFVAALEEFVGQVGADNAQWEALPVSAWPESFHWGDVVVASRLDRGQQIETIVRLAHVLEAQSRA